MSVVESTDLPYPRLKQGKVRELYDVDDYVLMVASDRISAFDCVLPDPVPQKGEVLTQISAFWFRRTEHIVQNHLVSADPDEIVRRVPELEETRERWAWRGMLVRAANPFDVECVVRGYLAGSGWREYREGGRVCGHELPDGLRQGDRLPESIFTPATKAAEGHDENISFEQMKDIVGAKLAHHLREHSLDLYEFGSARAEEDGVLLADTKYEFGFAHTGEILLIDEVMTPDSSRYWPEEEHEPGRSQPSLDKQPVRDYLEELAGNGQWNKEPPAPSLPDDVISATTDRYLELYRRVTGEELPSLYSA